MVGRRHITKSFQLGLLGMILAACRLGGEISGGADLIPSPSLSVDQPSVVLPSSNPFYSKENTLTLRGQCGLRQTVVLAGASEQEAACDSDNSYTFEIQKTVDGIYAFSIFQRDISNRISESVPFTWVRKTSISQPVLSFPSSSPYLSSLSQLVLSGNCENASTVRVLGDGINISRKCNNSAFTATVNKGADGDYLLSISQTDPAGNSASINLEWQRRALVVLPSVASLPVTQSQVFGISGGSGNYTLSFQNNNSGATIDDSTKTYTAGTLAGVTDNLLVTDTLGVSTLVQITVVPGVADHLERVDPEQDIEQRVGLLSSTPLRLLVVDAFDNPVSSYPILFEAIHGRLLSPDSPLQLSNAQGLVELDLLMPLSQVRSLIRARPRAGSFLPNVGGNDAVEIDFVTKSLSTSKGNLGLSFDVGLDPSKALSQDLNGDGKKDFIVLNAGENRVAVHLARGAGLFNTAVNYSLSSCSSPSSIALKDFDGDFILDILVLCSGNDTLRPLKGASDGSFQVLSPIGSFGGSEKFEVADLNKDGKWDLVFMSPSQSKFAVYFGNGDLSFNVGANYDIESGPRALAVADFNADGNLDVLLTSQVEQRMRLWQGDETGSMTLMPDFWGTGMNPSDIKVGDFNKDGLKDAAVMFQDDNVLGVYLNDQGLGFESVSVLNAIDGLNSMLIADVNGDSNLDVLSTHISESKVLIFSGNGGGQFVGPQMETVSPAPVFVGVDELTGDALSDIFVLAIGTSPSQLQLLPGLGNNKFGTYTSFGEEPGVIATGDLDNDGKEDAVVSLPNSSRIQILWGLGNGFFEAGNLLNTGARPSKILMHDISRDGLADILVVNRNSNSFNYFESQGARSFANAQTFGTGLAPSSMALADLNRDGFLDAVVSAASGNQVNFFAGNSFGSFDSRVSFSSGAGPEDLTIGDFNNDGLLDVATVDMGGNSVSLLLGDGIGTFVSATPVPVGVAPNKIVAEDFNRDGRLDLVVLNSGDGNISVLRGKGDGAFQVPDTYDGGGGVDDMVAADFNGDGNLDLAITNVGALNSITVLYGVNGLFTNSENRAVDTAIDNLGVCDLNNDGAADLIFSQGAINRMDVWLGH